MIQRYINTYICMVLLYGLLLVYFTPPMQSPDENTHFYNSYAVSQGDLFPVVSNADFKIGRYFPKAIGDFVDYYQEFFRDENNKIKIETMQTDMFVSSDMSILEFKEYWNADTSPVAYIAPAVGMWIAEHIEMIPLTPYNLLFAGRIANLLLFTVISVIAIVITPIFKKIYIMLLLMPSTVSLAASLNYDALLIPTVFLLFSLVMNLICSVDKINKTDAALLICVSVVLMSVKQAYFPLMLIAFFIPIKKFLVKKDFYLLALTCLILAIFTFFMYTIPLSHVLGNVKEVNLNYLGQSEQISYLLSHFYVVPELIVNSIRKFAMFYGNSFFGNLGGLNILFAPSYSIIYLLLLFITMLQDVKIPYKISYKLRVVSIIAVLLTIVFMFVGTYIIWTTNTVGIGANYVDGVQGRYFIMLVPFVCILFCHNGLPKKIAIPKGIALGSWYRKNVNLCMFDFALLYANICLFVGVVLILLRFWI